MLTANKLEKLVEMEAKLTELEPVEETADEEVEAAWAIHGGVNGRAGPL